MRRMSENVGASTSRNPKGLHGLYGYNFKKKKKKKKTELQNPNSER
jgi:hypothetical protein